MTTSLSGWDTPTSQIDVEVAGAERLHAQVDFIGVAAWAVCWEPRGEVRRPSDVVFAAVDDGFVPSRAEPDV